MAIQPITSLLVDYFEQFIKDQNLESFREKVSKRYNCGTLERVLAISPHKRARQAAVLALGLLGGFENNAAVGKALYDHDEAVRELAEHSLWAIWFRAGTQPENAKLREIARLIGEQQLPQAIKVATDLIRRNPKFAEAYNQRAIASYSLGDWNESLADCQKAIELNPYHFGAQAGLGHCYLHLNKHTEALKAYRKALQINPNMQAVRQSVKALQQALGDQQEK